MCFKATTHRGYNLNMRKAFYFSVVALLILPSSLLGGGMLSDTGKKALERDAKLRREFAPINYCVNPLDYGFKVSNQKGPDNPLTVRILVLRVDFQQEDPDDPLTTGDGKFVMQPQGDSGQLNYDPPHDKVYFQRMMEMASHYFSEETMGGVNVEFVVKPDDRDSVYHLPHKMRYYGDWDFWAQGIVLLVKDAIEAADMDPTVDFDDLDGNGTPDQNEGVLPVVMLFHAGAPYQTDVIKWDTPLDIPALTAFSGAFYYYLGNPFILANNGTDTIWSCSIMPEQMAQDGWDIRLQATLVHELTHLIWEIPDLYDISFQGIGVGGWDQQGSAAYLEDPDRDIPPGLYPVLHSAWSRLGWMNWYFKNYAFGRGFLDDSVFITVDPSQDDTTIQLWPACAIASQNLDTVGTERSPRFAIIPINDKEYYIVENRLRDLNGDDDVQPVWKDGVVVGPQFGEWDFLLPGQGLLIWHVDEAIIESTNYYEMQTVRPMGLDLEEADGVQDLEYWGTYPYDYFGSPYDPFYKGNNTEFGPNTTPDTRANRGGYTGILIHDVSESGRPMSFSVRNQRKAWSATAGGPAEAMPMVQVADLNGDGTREVLVARAGRVDTFDNYAKYTAKIYAFKNDGSFYFNNLDGLFAQVRDSVSNYHYYQEQELVSSQPAVGDLDGDGVAEVVFGTTSGQLFAFSASDNNYPGLADTFPGFPLNLGKPMRASVSLVDIDNDGDMEILLGHDGNWFGCLNPTGSSIDTLFWINTGSVVRTSPGAIGDTVFLVGGDSRLHLLDPSGQEKPGFPLGDESPFPNYGWAAAGDIDGDGQTEIVFFSNQDTSLREYEGRIICVNTNGVEEWSRPVDKPIATPISLGDMDGDGKMEAAWVANSKLFCVNSLGALVSGYPVQLPEIGLDSLRGYSAPVFGQNHLLVAVSRKGIFAYDENGQVASGYPIQIEGNAPQSPVLSDICGDKNLELIVADSMGNLSVWHTNDTIALWPNLGHDQFHHNNAGVSPYTGSSARSSDLSRVYFYPNPSWDGRIWLRFNVSGPGELKCEIYTFAGELLQSHTWQVLGGGMEEKRLDISDLAPDVYMARVVFGDKTKIVKFAVNKDYPDKK